MYSHSYRKNYTFIFILLAPVISLSCTILLFSFLNSLGLFEFPAFADNSKTAQELFSRLLLLWPIVLFYGPLIFIEGVRNRFISERWILIALMLFALGAVFALGDPYHEIRGEANWVRYATAGVLGAAGIIAIAYSVSSKHRLHDQLFGGLFGFLLVTAASDELLQFHERAGGAIEDVLPSGAQISGQDTVTLAVAVIGTIALVLAALVWQFLPWSKALVREPRYRRTFSFFALAVVSFLAAMLLDSYDWYLERLIGQLQASILGTSELIEAPKWLAVGYVSQAANSLEELLEYLAATFFLMMIGSLFSVRKLGFEPQSSQTSAGPPFDCSRPGNRVRTDVPVAGL